VIGGERKIQDLFLSTILKPKWHRKSSKCHIKNIISLLFNKTNNSMSLGASINNKVTHYDNVKYSIFKAQLGQFYLQ